MSAMNENCNINKSEQNSGIQNFKTDWKLYKFIPRHNYIKDL